MKSSVIENFKNTYCRLKPSKISGVGVFAVRDIPQNKNLFQGIKKHKWYKLRLSDFKNFDKEILRMIDDFFSVEKDGKVWVPEVGLNGIDISFFLNTSESPNVKTADKGFTFLTMRKIKKGEELTVSYKSYD
ncbi:SET domain-containing protein [Patescibacteria group bacterium]|nr:SET domain-containing protein [Patescibacteria group bacterium]